MHWLEEKKLINEFYQMSNVFFTFYFSSFYFFHDIKAIIMFNIHMRSGTNYLSGRDQLQHYNQANHTWGWNFAFPHKKQIIK